MSENAIVVRESEPAGLVRYGDRDSLELLANRIGMFFAIGAEKKNEVEKQAELKKARPALLKAAQLTYQYGYVPGMDVYVIPRGKTYSAEPSLEAWKKTADRHAFIGRFRYTVDVEELTPDEVKQHTDPDVPYDLEDRGARARLFRFDVAREMKDLGIPYRPTVHYGFWRKNAREESEWEEYTNARGEVKNRKVSTGKYVADTVPAQRTRQDVAIRRATRAAIMAEFPMIPLDDFAERVRVTTAMRYLEVEIEERGKPDGEEPGTLTQDQPGGYMDDNGDVWATEQPRHRKPVVTIEAAPMMAAGQPANGDGWGDWVTQPDILTAYQWGANSGKFKGGSHAQAAWNKIQTEYNGKPVSEFLAAWRDYVNNHAGKPQKEVQKEETKQAASVPAASGAEGGDTQGANGSGQASNGGPAATVSPAWMTWQKVDDLFGWAVEAGHYETLDQARVAFANMLSFKGLRYSKQNVAKVHEAWFDFHPAEETIEEGEFVEVPAF